MSDEHQDMRALLLRGIELARAGKKDDARAIFEQVLQADQYNEQAWLWMASVARSTAERREALEIALEINPQNQQARAALEHLGGPRARRKADAAREIAARIGSDETLTEEDFQPVVKTGSRKMSFVGEWRHVVGLPGIVPTYSTRFLGYCATTQVSTNST